MIQGYSAGGGCVPFLEDFLGDTKSIKEEEGECRTAYMLHVTAVHTVHDHCNDIKLDLRLQALMVPTISAPPPTLTDSDSRPLSSRTLLER